MTTTLHLEMKATLKSAVKIAVTKAPAAMIAVEKMPL